MSGDDRPLAWVSAPGLWRIRGLQAFLPEYRLQRLPSPRTRAVLGWGRKGTSWIGRTWAARAGLPYLALEDGFLRSIGLGEAGASPHSLLIDDLGVHHDARQPSRLESLIREPDGWFDTDMEARARALIGTLRETGLSKTSMGRLDIDLPLASGPRVLMVDQTAGDASIAGGLANRESFLAMAEAARAAAGGGQLLVRRHPATVARLKTGCLPPEALTGAIPVDDMALDVLLPQVDAVFAVSSGLGFEALIRGLPVHCFGLPFYAGWGLTTDSLPAPRRGDERSLEVLVAAALIVQARYVDPVTDSPSTPENTVCRLLQQRDRARRLAGYSACVGFSPAKRGAVRRLMNTPLGETVFFASTAAAVTAARERDGRLVVWAGKEAPDVAEAAEAASLPLWRMEDGFLRSRGLGSDFNAALSVVLDPVGIHFDGSRPSALELALEAGQTPAADVVRARALRQVLIERGLSKYNLGGETPPGWPRDRPRILIVGQVENDRSILLGCEDIATNAALVRAVRKRFPDAFLIYRDHPDTVAGNRPGRLDADTATLVDARAEGLNISACIDVCDVLATMTSLTGLEALLRGKRVMTWGRPSYAGWGLTEDALAFPRRTRRVDLDTLIAEALIRYPLYVTPDGYPCEAEDLARWLANPEPSADSGRTGGLRRWERGLIASLDRGHPPAY
ncbi:capsular polysaccharide biosynthesis protein [Brevundimonas sp.]|uniref:capsular polysaccharide biosynthesis protein n=1 Tax=Brevundimonas sp. TaxID=1871086 RepID=UPI001D99876C|nr:capsular polysaccharide biosynthesis protein [Brevundimonas sp.]MBL0946872.1 capsular polysaccharide biosynthesis protein [Brevundimonas sp.]